MTDIVERLRDGFEEDELRAGRELMAEAADEIERLRAELSICREAIEICYSVADGLPSDGDVEAAVRRATMRRLNEAVGKATPRLLMERPEGQKFYGLRWIELNAECDALRADAERYRWLREHNASDGRIHLTYVGAAIKRATTPKGEMLDAAIDAAMANDSSK